MLQRVFEHAGRLLPSDRRYPTERWVRGWLEAQRLARADYVVVSFGKSGRTWIRVMISRLYQLLYGLRRDDLLEFGNYHRQDRRIPRILFTHDNYLRDYTGDGVAKRAYAGTRVILLVRHPADVALSQYYQWKHRMRAHKKVLNQYPPEGAALSAFEFMVSPSGLAKVIAFLNEWSASLDALPATLVVRYEDLRRDTAAELRRVARFLDVAPPDPVIAAAVEYAAFENMRQREAEARSDSGRLRAADPANPDSFKTRRGKVGGYQDDFDDAQVAQIEATIARTLDPRFGYVTAAEGRP